MKSKNIKKIILGSFLGIIIGSLIGTAYAMFTYNSTSTNSKLVVGDIYMKYKETTALTLENAMPSTTYDSNYKFEFTIEGKNTTTDKDIWYEIKVKRGNIPNGKTEQDRIPDRFIKYRLVEQIDNGTENVVVDGDSWEGLNLGKTIYVDKINKNQTTNTEHKYKLYMWISNKLVIGNDANADFTIANWNKAFASIKVDVTGDFTTKEVDEPYMTVNAMYVFPTVITDQKANIKEVYFNKMDETTMNTRYNAATIKADLTYNNEGKVLAWLETNTQDNTKYNLYVASDGKTYFMSDGGLFRYWNNVETIQFNNVNTSRLSGISSYFQGCSKLKSIDLSTFDTTNIVSAGAMFEGCESIISIDISNFGVSKLVSVYDMFKGCINLEEINMQGFHFSGESVSGLFKDLSKLEYINLNNSNFANCRNFSEMFSGCVKLNSIDWDDILTGNIDIVNSMFLNCEKITNIDLSHFNLSNLANVGTLNMFKGCSLLEKIYVSPNTDFSNQPSGMSIFGGDTNLVGGNGTHYDDDNPKDKTYAIIDGTNGQPGYLTDIADKPTT